MPSIRVMAWNIAEGKGLDEVVRTLRGSRNDIVLLNEIRNPVIGTDQTDELAEELRLPHRKYMSTAATGLSGTKGVAILSRYPLLSIQEHRVWFPGESFPIKFGTLQATIEINGLLHEVFSLRFTPIHPRESSEFREEEVPENRALHEHGLKLVQSIPQDRAVIYGGDLNISYLRHVIEWPHATWWTKFRDECGLTDVIAKRPPPNVNLDDRVDYIYYHGPYEVSAASMPLGLPGSSDHSYVFTMLTRTDLPRDVLVPDLRTMLREQAVETVSRTDLLLAFTGAVNEPNTWVYSQSPHWLRSVVVGTTVTMELKTGVPAVKVPWVTEMTPQSAADELRSAGLKVRFTGGASAGGDPYVSGQNPRGDEIAFPGETVTCHLEGGPIP